MQQTLSVHKGKVDVTPDEVGYDPAMLNRLDDHYSRLIGKGTIQAAGYILSRHGQIFAHRTLGKLRPTEDSPDLEPDSIRKTYSITKAFTSVAIHQLMDRGQIFLDQQVSSIIPEFDTDKHRSITIAQLLTHTSGLNGDPGFFQEPFALPWYEWAVREIKKSGHDISWVRAVLSGPLQNMPGKEWIYSTAGFALLGEIIAKVSGIAYEQYIADEILTPLGMSKSGFTVDVTQHEQLCYVNSWELESITPVETIDRERPPKAGNGLYSTLEELCTFGRMMLGGGEWNGTRILSRRAVELQTSNQLNGVLFNGWGERSKDTKYGLGWSLNHDDICSKGTYSHEGFGHSGLYIDPVEDLVFAFFVPGLKGYTNESVVIPRAIVWSGLL
ncbi:serine hydrolase domain-containing protein [Paenibacillus crassostreae]|uniref:Serine hydrolase n=1 Tax=Paenibacillus crassostreae TaxID=1763538 RepID=A0A167FGQ9_9BACL|nr:serine hydrolase domain-containing protein [Paenibacillus crassostreae]AOZ94421.1 serine hydrolase [Paenibacillus crassostreae]OAB76542.1 serine hydrolase [Paenibacillus crassostreae]